MIARGGGQQNGERTCRYYVCINHHLKGKDACTNSLSIRVEKVDKAFLDYLADEILQSEMLDKAVKIVIDAIKEQAKSQPGALKIKQQARSRLQKEVKRLVDALATGGKQAPKVVMQEISTKESQLDRLDQEIAQLEALPKADDATIRRDMKLLESSLKDSRQLLQGTIPQCRQVLKKIFPARLIFQPGDRQYLIVGKCQLESLSTLGSGTNPFNMP